ncbi:MAG: coenzyme F420-0:L-glutamate ligase [Veillonellaceae bacterium]|nr:coenzyme F420-0:L-glutamate ligase [Veillonellaceae bacterium]
MAQLELVPVHTRILTPKDNIVNTILEYAGQDIGPEDIVCVAESVVAITQGHFTRPEELKPSWKARFLCRFVPADGSMSSVYGMQAAMNLEGEWKTMFCFFAGAIAKIFRKNGVFYQLARQASLTDDVTGTMPPFDKHIVYGPKHPNQVAEQIVQRTGCYGAVVADVNDLKRSAVLGHSRGLDPKRIARILINNPFGNDSQMTPIVIIKNFASVAREQQ